MSSDTVELLLRPHGLPLDTIVELRSVSMEEKALPQKPLPQAPSLDTSATIINRSLEETKDILGSPLDAEVIAMTAPLPDTDLETKELCKVIDALWSTPVSPSSSVGGMMDPTAPE